jgi:large subunit ribosomal protein L25
VSEVKISAEPRTEFGKGGARRTRRAGKVPAVLYGHGEKPQHIALPAREFAAAIRHGGLNQVFTIDIAGGSTTLALPKAIQRDPIKDTYEHVDLIIVRRGEQVQVDVPITLTGEAAKNTLVVNESTTLAVVAEARGTGGGRPGHRRRREPAERCRAGRRTGVRDRHGDPGTDRRAARG